MAQLDVTELDFDTIKQNLKTFLSSQSEFNDYNFEGAGMNVLLDTLSYNTHYNAMLAHLLANESFLDTATKRASVVSLAKSLGYTPRSARGSTATINFSVALAGSTETSLTLSRNTVFATSLSGETYNFYPRQSVTVTKETRSGVSGFFFDNVQITEGTRVANSFLVTASNVSGPFTIPNQNVDTTTLRVRVQESQTNLNVTTWQNYTNLTDVTTTTKAYFLEEDIDGLYILRFGDDYIGKKLAAGNVVLVDYIVTQGAEANSAINFTTSNTFLGAGETKAVTLVAQSSAGQGKETIDSIRKTAPRYNQTRNRAVTSEDYQSLILNSNSNLQSVAVWGGETNDPPMYGRVFIALDPAVGQIVTDADKNRIVTEIITPKAPLGIQAEFVDPSYLYIQLKLNVEYNPKVTTLTPGELRNSITTAVSNYFNTELNVLNKNFYVSSLHKFVKDSSSSIISININPKMQLRMAANTLGTAETFNLRYNNRLEPRTLHTTWFTAKIETGNVKVKLVDVPDAGVVPPEYNGTGKIYLQDVNGDNISNVGTVNYDTGAVDIIVNIVSYFDSDVVVRANFKPHDDVKDIKTQILTRQSDVSTSSAVVALPSKNTVLRLDDTALNATTNARRGLDIVLTQQVLD